MLRFNSGPAVPLPSTTPSERAADTLLLGATTCLVLKSYWPAVADNPRLSPAVARDPGVAELHVRR